MAAPVDSLLSLVYREGADELRLGTDRAPAMFASGAPKRLSMPKTPGDMLRHLLGDLLSKDVDARLRESGKAETTHDVGGIGSFRVVLSRRDDGAIDATFVMAARGTKAEVKLPAAAAAPPPRAPAAPVAVPPLEPAPSPEPALVAPSAAPRSLDGALAALLLRAQAMGASDLHLAEGEPPTVRLHGALSMLDDDVAPDLGPMLASVLDAKGHAALSAGSSVDFALSLASQEGARAPRVRGNAYRTSRGVALALRLLPPEAPSLDSLAHGGLLDGLATLPNGLVIVAGPTGSGKTTTLTALAREALRRRSIVLVTLEDPIEYVLAGVPGRSLVRQRQIGRDARDFATGLRDALREDPDVIVVGEMRDPESMALALTAAETGHLVLTTLHSRSAASAIERIVDAMPEERQQQIRSQLADSLRAVVAQRLVPRARGGGRALALEVLRVTTSVASGLREGKLGTITSAMQSGRREGMILLEKSLAELVRRGEIGVDEARAVANDREALAGYASGAG